MGNFNYFAEGEQAAQHEFQSHRDRLLGPVVRLLIHWRITPNVISAVSMLALAPFCWMVLTAKEPWSIAVACLFLLLHVTLDGIDGPLARKMDMAGPAGAFVDMCCDHGGLVIVVWTLSAAGLVDGTVGNIYVSLYTMAVVFIVWLNSLGNPFRFVIRSKYFLYLILFALSLVAAGNPRWDWLDYSMLLFSAGNLWICIIGFLRVYSILAARQQTSSKMEP